MFKQRYLKASIVLLTLGLVLSGDALCAEKRKNLSGKKVVMIVPPKKYRDEELVLPRTVLEKRGAIVKVASLSLKKARGMLGGSVKLNQPHKSVAAVP